MCYVFLIPIGFQSAEYTVLIEFYSKLVDVLQLQVESITPYLIEEHVLSLQDKGNLETISSRKRATEFILSKVSAPLKAGFTNCAVSFYKLLDIAKQYGNADTIQLCNEIEERLITLKQGDQFN